MSALREQDAAARAVNPVGRDFSEALARGLRIIAAFNSESPTRSLSDLSRVVDLPRATVRRSLLTLVHLGFVELAGRDFRLTPKVLTLAGAYLESTAVTTILQPACERLAADHGEIFSVAVMDAPDAVMVAYARARSMYMIGDGIGLRIPAHCTAVGRVLLAGLAEPEREAFLDRHGVAAVTSRTITDRAELARVLAQVEAENFAVVESEAELGFRSMAVPVRCRNGRTRFALNVGMATQRCPLDEARDWLIPVLEAEAERLGSLLI
jgi:IclR family pca regulon transcriptional regulator